MRRRRSAWSARSSASLVGIWSASALTSTDAPPPSKAMIASTRPAFAANISGVCPQAVSPRSTSAPYSISAATEEALPDAAARWSGATLPVVVPGLGVAPACRSARTTLV